MRILMLLPRFPYPPQRGDTLRSWGILRVLAERHEVWLACGAERRPSRAAWEEVRRRCAAMAVVVRPGWRRWLGATWGGLLGRSLLQGYFADARLAEVLREWDRSVRFDTVFTYTAALAPLAALVSAPRRLLDLCDVDSAKWAYYAGRAAAPLRWLHALEARRTARLEAAATRAHDVSLLVNERERRKLAAGVPDAITDVLPTVVDGESGGDDGGGGHGGGAGGSGDGPERCAPPVEPVVSMVGAMCYPPNVWAVEWFGRAVWPRVRARLPQAQWWLVGRDPVRKVRRWGRAPGVTVTGYVPDVRPYLRACRVFVAPVSGELGVQSKVLAALAAGCPAVVRSDVAAGLTYDGPAPFLIADEPGEFADAVVRLATDAELWRRLSRRARQVVAREYSVARVATRLEGWLSGASDSRTRPAPVGNSRRFQTGAAGGTQVGTVAMADATAVPAHVGADETASAGRAKVRA